ncbi:MAG: flavin-containing monooxygenase [Microthrixaceae bacterium]
MSTESGAAGSYDPEAIHAKYLAERDRRLVPGRNDISDLDHDERFARYRDDPYTPYVERDAITDEVDVCILGGGIAGMLVGVQLRKAGVDNFRIIDSAGGLGGTWYWNRYPGVMCDIESYIYLPMLEELDYIPKHRYSFGDEILAHLEAIGERYDLDRGALFHTGVSRAEWDEGARRWHIDTDRGDRISARYYVLAVGMLNLLKLPALDGMEDFEGHSFHSSRWDYDYTGGGPGEAMTNLGDKVVGVMGTGATGIQLIEPLAQAAKAVYVFQRTPSAIGERGNRPTEEDFGDDFGPGWQRDRMDNFQAIMLGREVEADLVDDGWTHHYSVVHNPGRRGPDESVADWILRAEEADFEIMEYHRNRVADLVDDPEAAEALKPWYRYLCKRPCFHDEFLPAFNHPNVTLVSSPGGAQRVAPEGLVVDDQTYELDCLIYATGFEPEITPLHRRAGHDIVGPGGTTLAESWADGASTLYGMMMPGFPNLFTMPAPGQQAVVTVNYTQLAVLGAEFIGRTVGKLADKDFPTFEVSAEAGEDWTAQIVKSFVNSTSLMAACTPSRVNNEGHPELMNPRNGNYGRGFGDFFGYRDVVIGWVDDGTFEGLDLR